MSWVEGHEPDEEEITAALDGIYGEMKGVRENQTKRARKHPMDHQRQGSKGRTSPVTDYVRSLGNYKTTAEVAEEIGRSEGWVRKAAKKRWTQAPSKVAPFGDTHIFLYTEEDIQALRDYLEKNSQVYDRDDYPFDEEAR